MYEMYQMGAACSKKPSMHRWINDVYFLFPSRDAPDCFPWTTGTVSYGASMCGDVVKGHGSDSCNGTSKQSNILLNNLDSGFNQ